MRNLSGIVISAVLAFFMSACQINIYYPNELDRFESLSAPSTVLLIYGIGFNNLSSSIQGNLNTIAGNILPAPGSDQVVLSFTNFSKGDTKWQQETPSHLIRYSIFEGKVRRDTLLTLEAGRKAVDPQVMKEVLDYVKGKFKAERYGLILSSHGSGWLPTGYVQDADVARWMHFHETGVGTAKRAPSYSVRRFPALDGPATKTFGAEYHGTYRIDADDYEMSIPHLAEALGTGWNFIVFDACFMASVEVVYELRHFADVLCVSAAEVISSGFNYRNMTDIVFRRKMNPEDICRSFFNLYKGQTGAWQSATIANVRTAGLDDLAQTCKALALKYKAGLAAVDTNAVQLFSRGGRKWFFDLQDIFAKSGISPADSAILQQSLDACISYKAATPKLFEGSSSGELEVKAFCGLTMYLPAINNRVLSDYYKQTAWNKEVNLVED